MMKYDYTIFHLREAANLPVRWLPVNSKSSSWSQCFSERVDRGVALANSKLAKCQSRIWRSLDDKYTSLRIRKKSNTIPSQVNKSWVVLYLGGDDSSSCNFSSNSFCSAISLSYSWKKENKWNEPISYQFRNKLTLQAAVRSLNLLLTRNAAVISLGCFTLDASCHCLFRSAMLSFNVSVCEANNNLEINSYHEDLIRAQTLAWLFFSCSCKSTIAFWCSHCFSFTCFSCSLQREKVKVISIKSTSICSR